MRDDQCMLWNVLIPSLNNQAVFCEKQDAFLCHIGKAQKYWELQE